MRQWSSAAFAEELGLWGWAIASADLGRRHNRILSSSRLSGLVERQAGSRGFRKDWCWFPCKHSAGQVDVQQGRLTSIDLVVLQRFEQRRCERDLRHDGQDGCCAQTRFGFERECEHHAGPHQADRKCSGSSRRLVLVLLSCVAMLTALFIILSTLSMGMIERVAFNLGLLRCVGVTSWQLAWLVMVEVVTARRCWVWWLACRSGLVLAVLTVQLVRPGVRR
jgi:hypothetical protein